MSEEFCLKLKLFRIINRKGEGMEKKNRRPNFIIFTQKRSCASQTIAKTRLKSSSIRRNKKSRNKPRISENSSTCRIRICDLLQSRNFESHALSTQPRNLNNRQTLDTIKAAILNCQCHSAKVVPNTNRLNLLNDNLEYN